MTVNINYTKSYFKYPTPTPINGESTNKAPKQLKKELRANTSSTDTDLGGGDHGYLVLVLPDVEYANINPTPTLFVAPAYLAPLMVLLSALAVEAINLRLHKKALNLL